MRCTLPLFLPCDALCAVLPTCRPSVCLSVCQSLRPSVTLVDWIVNLWCDHTVRNLGNYIGLTKLSNYARTISWTSSLFEPKGNQAPAGEHGEILETRPIQGLGKMVCWSTKAAISLIISDKQISLNVWKHTIRPTSSLGLAYTAVTDSISGYFRSWIIGTTDNPLNPGMRHRSTDTRVAMQCLAAIRGVYSIEAWAQLSLRPWKKNEGGTKIMHIFVKIGGGEEKLRGEEILNYVSTYLHCLPLIFSKIFSLAPLAWLHFIFIPQSGDAEHILQGR